MRIISGYLKGKKLLEPKDKTTRPLKDLTKESIFNVIKHSNKIDFSLKNSNILDCFSGVGSFGLEALSREAGFVTFIENYLGVIEILKKNIENLRLIEKCKIKKISIHEYLETEIPKRKYDLIFLDPPFKDTKINELLLKIFEKNILRYQGIIIIHRDSKKNHIFPEIISIKEKKTYGISQIFFCGLNQ